MFTDIDKYIIYKFLERNYPVKRIKHNMKFKRAIIIDGGLMYFFNKNDLSKSQLKDKLTEILKKNLCYDEIIIRIVLNDFLGF